MQNSAENNKPYESIEDILKSVRGMIHEHEQDKESGRFSTTSTAQDSVTEESESILELTHIIPEGDDSGLMSEEVRRKTGEKVKDFVREVKSSTRIGDASDDVSLEQTMEKIAKPLIKSWLDHNLTAIVERVLREELKKIIPNR